MILLNYFRMDSLASAQSQGFRYDRPWGLSAMRFTAKVPPLVTRSGDTFWRARMADWVANNKTALIIGATGQDGAYLARHLSAKGYAVWGTSRDAVAASTANFRSLGVEPIPLLTLNTLDVDDIRSVLRRITPCEIYNLSGQSSVARSFLDPAGTHASIAIATINVLEAARAECPQARMYFACSSECFGDIRGAADETTPFAPKSPYAVAKAAAHWTVSNYRTAYGLFACSGILFNHESPLRQPHYVTRKIIQGAARIAAGSGERLSLGNLHIRRDWGWAGDYVDAMWLMLQQDVPEDFVIATGVSTTLEDFVQAAFEGFDLDWRAHVDIDSALFRPSDIAESCGNARMAREKLGWVAQTVMPDLVTRLVTYEKGIQSS